MSVLKEVWVVCGNDFPAGCAYTTEEAAGKYCEEMNAKEFANRPPYFARRIHYHYHRVEVRS